MKKILIGIAVMGAALFASAEYINEAEFLYRAPVTFPGYTIADDTLENFPVLVRLSETQGGFSYADASDDGSDIRFALADGTLLNSEVSLWDPDGESQVWVSVPALSAGASVYLYWGGSHSFPASQTDGSVWTSAGYFAVWHMDEDSTSTTAKDSAGGAMNGTHVNTMPGQSDAKVGRSVRISDSGWNVAENKGIRTAAYSNVGSDFVFTLWAKYPNQNVGNDRLAGHKTSWDGNSGWEISGKRYDGNNLDFRGASGTSAEAPVAMKNMDWSHMVFVFEENKGTFYLNNSWKTTKTLTSATDNDVVLVLGNAASMADDSFKGWMDEVRLRKGGMSRNWITTEYNSVNNVNFVAVGAAEAVIPAGDVPLMGAVSVSETNRHDATISWTLRAASSSAESTVKAWYGTDAGNLSQSQVLASGADIATGTHASTISGLTCASDWYVKIVATGADGSTESEVMNFRTAGTPVFGDVETSFDGLAVTISGSLEDAGAVPLDVAAMFGADSSTWTAVETWTGVSAARTFEAETTVPSLGEYTACMHAEGTCPDCAHVVDVWTPAVDVLVFGGCRWTGEAGDFSWNTPGNWSSGTVPGAQDSVIFDADSALSGKTISLDAAQTVDTIFDRSGVSFSIGSSDDVSEGRALKLKNFVRSGSDSTTLTIAAPVVLAAAESGTNMLSVAAGVLRFGGTVAADALNQPVLMDKAGTVALAGEGGEPQPHFLVVAGVLQPERQAALHANVTVGGGDSAALLNCTVNNAISGVDSVTTLTNGTAALRQTNWNFMANNLSAADGSTISVSGFAYKVNLTGGALQGGSLQCGSYNGQGIFCHASALPSFFNAGFTLNQYGPATILVEDGEAIVDLTISGGIGWAGDSWNSFSKNGDGTLRMTGATAAKSTQPFKLNGGTLLCDTVSGTPIGNTLLQVNAGTMLGGCGFLGGYENGNVEVVGTEANPATVAPGSINETTGAHVYGTLTVGSEAQANTVSLGAFTRVKIGVGPKDAHTLLSDVDRLTVNGGVTIGENCVLDLTSNTAALDTVSGGTFTILSATDGITGEFANVIKPKSSWKVTYVSEQVGDENVVKSITLTLPRKGLMISVR